MSVLPVLLLAALLSAGASTGVGIQSAPVCLSQPARPGHAYPLTVGVVNTGSAAEQITVRVARLGPELGLPVPASWLNFPGPVTVAPRGVAQVRFVLTVPAGARRGHYRSDVIAQSGGTAGQITLAAAAATVLRFSVSTRLPGASRAPLTLILAGILAATVLVVALVGAGRGARGRW